MTKNLILIRSFLNLWVLNKNFVISVTSVFLLTSIFIVFRIILFYWLFYSPSILQVGQPEMTNQESLPFYTFQTFYFVIFAPIFESILLGLGIFGLSKLDVTEKWAILIPALVLATFHIVNNFYYPFRVLPLFLIYSYVFLYSLKITSVFGAICRIAVPHALNNCAILFFAHTL